MYLWVVSPMEVAQEIDNNINSKKAPKYMMFLLDYWKSFQKERSSCFYLMHVLDTPILLLPVISKLFKKLLLNRFIPRISIFDSTIITPGWIRCIRRNTSCIRRKKGILLLYSPSLKFSIKCGIKNGSDTRNLDLNWKTLKVANEETNSSFHPISAGV